MGSHTPTHSPNFQGLYGPRFEAADLFENDLQLVIREINKQESLVVALNASIEEHELHVARGLGSGSPQSRQHIHNEIRELKQRRSIALNDLERLNSYFNNLRPAR